MLDKKGKGIKQLKKVTDERTKKELTEKKRTY